MGGYDLGLVHGKITLDASGVTAGITAARQALQGGMAGMATHIQSLGDQMTGLGGRITALTAPFTALSVSGLQTAADFDVLMKQIELFGGVTGEELEAVRQYALKMGADTQFSASDAGGALLDLLKSGQSLEEAMATLPEVLDLAAVGQMSLTQAAGVTTGGLAQFQLKATESREVTNALAQAASASRADVSDLGQALANVGPIAGNFGLDVEETAAVLGVFANNNIMGAEAGTQLKSMLLNLTRPTEDVQKAYAELGVSLYDSEGNVRDFNTVIQELDGVLDTLPVERQNELMQMLGGSYGIIGLSALRASDGIGDMLDAMTAAPDAGTLAGGFMDTVSGKLESLKGSFEAFKIEAFTPFMNEVIAPFLDRMVVVVNGITQWVAANPELTTSLLQIGSAVAVAGPALVGVGVAISTIGKVVAIASPLLGLLTSPLGLMAGAGLVLARVFDVDVRQAFEDAIAVVMPALESLRVWFVEDALPAVVDFVQNTFLPIVGQMGSAIGNAWAHIYPVLQRVYTWFVHDAIPAISDIIQTVFIPTMQDIGIRIGEIWAVVAPVLAQLYDWFVTTAIPAVANAIQTIFVPAVQGIAHVFKEIYETVAPILQFLIEWFVTQAVPIIAGLINDVIIPAIQTFIRVLGAIWNVVGPVFQLLIDWFQSTGWPLIEGIINTIITPAIDGFVNLLKGIWELVEPVINLLVDWFNNVIAPAVEAGVALVTLAVDGFIAIFTGIWTAIQDTLKKVEDWFNTTIAPVIQSAIDTYIKPVIAGFIQVFADIWKAIEEPLAQIRAVIEGVFNFIKDRIIQPLIDAILAIPNAVREAKAALDIFNGQAEIIKQTRDKALQTGASYDQIYANAHSEVSNAFGGGFLGDLAARVIAPGITSQVAPSRDSGGFGIEDMPYAIGNAQLNNEALFGDSGKLYIAPEDGTFVPNFVQRMEDFMNSQSSGAVYNITIQASSKEGGEAAAVAFVRQLKLLEGSLG